MPIKMSRHDSRYSELFICRPGSGFWLMRRERAGEEEYDTILVKWVCHGQVERQWGHFTARRGRRDGSVVTFACRQWQWQINNNMGWYRGKDVLWRWMLKMLGSPEANNLPLLQIMCFSHFMVWVFFYWRQACVVNGRLQGRRWLEG